MGRGFNHLPGKRCRPQGIGDYQPKPRTNIGIISAPSKDCVEKIYWSLSQCVKAGFYYRMTVLQFFFGNYQGWRKTDFIAMGRFGQQTLVFQPAAKVPSGPGIFVVNHNCISQSLSPYLL